MFCSVRCLPVRSVLGVYVVFIGLAFHAFTHANVGVCLHFETHPGQTCVLLGFQEKHILTVAHVLFAQPRFSRCAIDSTTVAYSKGTMLLPGSWFPLKPLHAARLDARLSKNWRRRRALRWLHPKALGGSASHVATAGGLGRNPS